MTDERRALLASAAMALALGTAALAVGLVTRSAAILLDGAFNISFFLAALFTLRIARLLERTDDADYPFGYMHYEPLIDTLKGLLILGINLLALLDAVRSLLGGGVAVEAGIALGYALAALAVCIGTLVYLRRANAGVGSPLVAGDVENWTVNTAISAGMVVAFVLATLLQRSGFDVAARYVDPLLVAPVVLLTAPIPFKMAKHGIFGLLKRAPESEVVQGVEQVVRDTIGELLVRNVFVRVVQPGRTTYALIHVVLPEDVSESFSIAQADETRRIVASKLNTNYAPIIVDIIFTAVSEFAEPTTGFGEASVGTYPQFTGAAVA